MLVTVNNRLTLEVEIVHDLSCHPILATSSLQSIPLLAHPYMALGTVRQCPPTNCSHVAKQSLKPALRLAVVYIVHVTDFNVRSPGFAATAGRPQIGNSLVNANAAKS